MSGPVGRYRPIEDYALIGDMHSCALVSTEGAVDWCCFPRFDSPSVFGRILDWKHGGYVRLAPDGARTMDRRYRDDTMILETTFETSTGTGRLVDFMPLGATSRAHEPGSSDPHRQLVRMLECEQGSLTFSFQCEPRFEYGSIRPRTRLLDKHHAWFQGGAGALSVYCSARLEVDEHAIAASGALQRGQRVWAAVSHARPREVHRESLDEPTLLRRLRETESFWREWSAIGSYAGRYRPEVIRSALTLKALSYGPSGAIIAAPTASLPEAIGGVRNWDYRSTWIRDATFALYALSIIGYHAEARAFKSWIEAATHGHAAELQVVYGVEGERRLSEVVVDELEGYRGSRPVRVGNAAHAQFQLDVYGELLDSAHIYRRFTGNLDREYWDFLQSVVTFVAEHWHEPDSGIWEMRGAPREFVYSKAMAWVALDRAIRATETLDLPGDVGRWRHAREVIRQEILARGFDREQGSFVQAYGERDLDASALLLPLVGFIAPDDPRMLSTVEAIRRELTAPNGLLFRYRNPDGLPGEEGVFVPCTLWLADNLAMQGRVDEARDVFERVCACANDVGLLSEEVDPEGAVLLGNFPQALSHLALINTMMNLERAESPAGVA